MNLIWFIACTMWQNKKIIVLSLTIKQIIETKYWLKCIHSLYPFDRAKRSVFCTGWSRAHIFRPLNKVQCVILIAVSVATIESLLETLVIYIYFFSWTDLILWFSRLEVTLWLLVAREREEGGWWLLGVQSRRANSRGSSEIYMVKVKIDE